MGKDLKGQQLGEGVDQRKDGKYRARIRDGDKRLEKTFTNMIDARIWILKQKKRIEEGGLPIDNSITLNKWFDYWLENIKGSSIRDTTKKCYINWYRYLREEMGYMRLSDIKPMHCQRVLNLAVNNNLSQGTITSIRKIMVSILYCAVENDLIPKNPVTKSVKVPELPNEKDIDRKVMTREEEEAFILAASKYYQSYLFLFVLQTGLRVGEVCAIKWSDIDYKNKILTIYRTVHKEKDKYIFNYPKTKAGIRKVPLTDEAIRLLEIMKEDLQDLPIDPEYSEYIFHNENGKLCDKNALNRTLNLITKRAKIRHLSMHCLRHTFATRCIEAGMKPKTLQRILGHKSINTTMNLYVHVTNEELHKEMNKFGIVFTTYSESVGVEWGLKAQKCHNRAMRGA